MDPARAKAFGSIQCDQRPSIQTLERGEYAVCLDRFEKHRIGRPRRGAVEHLADIDVCRYGRHAEQGVAIRPSVPLRQPALMSQEGGASHEKHRERREADVGHRVFAAARRSFALVRKAGADIFQFSDQELQDRHEPIESKIALRRQAKSSWIPARKQKIFGLLHSRPTQPGVAGIEGMAPGPPPY